MTAIVAVTAPATEPLTVADVMQHCRLDTSNFEPAPGIITAALAGAGAGNVENGVHRYAATFVTASGETEAGTVSAALTVADKTVNGKVALSAIPIGGSLVTSRKIYRTTAGGSTYLLLTTLADNTTTTYTDNTADASLGAGAPSSNTTLDPQITRWIVSARVAAEKELKRYLITQTLDAKLDRFPCAADADYPDILLPPLQSVTSITYVDTDGATQTLATNQYTLDASSTATPSRIAPAYNCSWPSTRAQNSAVTIRFVAGYGTAAQVPSTVKSWMLLQIEAMRVNPSAVVVGAGGSVQSPSSFVDGLLDGERVYGRLFA